MVAVRPTGGGIRLDPPSTQPLPTRSPISAPPQPMLPPSSSIRAHVLRPMRGATDLWRAVRESPAVSGVMLGVAAFGTLGAAAPTEAHAATVTTQPTTQARNRSIVYVGMNPGSSYELQELRSKLGASSITAVTPGTQDKATVRGVQYDLATDEGRMGFANALGLPQDRARALAEVLETTGDNARDEIAQLAKIFREVDRGERSIERIVLSGHSVGTSVWGDNNGSLYFSKLGDLALVFPRAAGQVQDLMLAACYSGGEAKMENYLAIFPNLKTVWAYDGSAPGAASGAVTHLLRWERATRGDATSLSRDVAKNSRKGENVATWSTARGYDNGMERGPLSADRERYESTHSIVASYLSGDQAVQDPQSGPLRNHYNSIQRLLGRPDLAAEERPQLEAERDQVIRLLFYQNVRTMFQTVYGNQIRAGFTELGLPAPDFSTLSRKDALERITQYDAKLAETPGASTAARSLSTRLNDGLVRLSPQAIPAAWI
jgi:hypothetical protein